MPPGCDGGGSSAGFSNKVEDLQQRSDRWYFDRNVSQPWMKAFKPYGAHARGQSTSNVVDRVVANIDALIVGNTEFTGRSFKNGSVRFSNTAPFRAQNR